MHFWINKPAGRYYGFSGRRYPATPVPKTRSGQCRHSTDLRQMVTPVHRFQSLSSTGNVAGPSNVNSCRPVRPPLRTHNETRNNSSVTSVQHTQLSNTSNNVTNTGNNQLILSNNTSAEISRSVLDYSEFRFVHSEFSYADLRNYGLNRGIWTTLVFGIAFGAVGKFYFGYQGRGLAILVLCGLLTPLLSAWLYSFLCRRTQRNNQEEHHIQEHHTTSLTTANATPNDNVRAVPVVRENPPPPYHIAILIPPPNSSDEAPPPSYDKIMR